MDTAPRTFGEAITPNHDQQILLYILAGYAVAILILWNVPYLKHILYPFKLFTVALHEFGHAAVGCCTGAKIHSIEVNPNEGGLTKMSGGISCCTLPAGYLGSSLFGALMIFCSFSHLAVKIMTGVLIACCLVMLVWARNWLTRILIVVFAGLLAFFIWFQNGIVLIFFVLFMGVMSCLYSLWDIVEDLVVRKVNESDATRFARKTGCPSQVCGALWFLVSLAFLTAGVIGGIAVFKDDFIKDPLFHNDTS
ncbi:hypothetical protein IWQ60_003930 [Tieghemiomyces parasiticus]|uniref:Peptidase M50B-like-domain-containing protein n=1 Tax=Tieghemiomyces parasiticus TaxID=78921 RepID=A0A9W8ACC0_9FUNG|nr:hypothetical protein IWQ60_003930 [Tieghemiomyces parasiticus]